MIRNCCILLLSFLSYYCYSQKIIERELDATIINSIEINSDNVSSILILSEKTNSIKITAQIGGEYYENVVLSLIEKDKILYLKSEYAPFYQAKNDKLAAHKIQSVEMELIVPERMKLLIKSSIASVRTKGKLQAISVNLESGNCILEEFTGDANLVTESGAITVTTTEKILAKAFSKNGKINNNLSKNRRSNYFINAETKDGEISLTQIH